MIFHRLILATASAALLAGTALAQTKTLVVGLSADPSLINSTLTTEISSSVVGAQVYSTIVRLDAAGEPEPSLAESWEVSPDGLTYTFRFFEGIAWHDGTPFTSGDVAWSLLNMNREYNGPAAGLLAAVERIETPDALTAVFHLAHPYPPLLRGLAYFNSSTIVPRHIFDTGSEPRQNPANLKPVGTGPYIFQNMQAGSHIELVRNPDYHLPGPEFDRLVFQIIPNEAARGLAVEQGAIDFIPYHVMPLGEVERLQSRPGVTIAFQKRMIAGQYMAFLNTREGPLATKEVRQALYHAMDRNELLEKAGFGHGRVSRGGPISSELVSYFSDAVPQYDHDPALAEEMLDAAGFPRGTDGKRFALRISYSLADGPMNDVARLLRMQFARIGVDIVDQGADAAVWRETAFVKWDYDIAMGSFASGPDPAIGAETFYTCARIEPLFGRNASGYCNPEVDALFAEAGREIDEDRRRELYAQASALVAGDVPHWWLWDRFYPIAFNASLEGITDDVTGYGTLDRVKLAD